MYQFHKADKTSLKMKAKAVLDKFIKSDPTKNDINTNCCTIKSILNSLLNYYVPYRTSEFTKSSQSAMDNKRSMRKRDRLFLELGNQIQKQTGQIFLHLGILLINQSYYIQNYQHNDC